MMMQNSNKHDLFITRVFDIPVEMVWKGWTDPKLVTLWWGPADYTSPRCEIDLREGGKYLFCMRAPEEQGGQDYYSTGVYTKIVPMERLEFTQQLSDRTEIRFIPRKRASRPNQVMQAMFTMNKLDIERLKQAAYQTAAK